VLDEPYGLVAAAVICADDEKHARRIAAPGGLSFLKLRHGEPSTLPSPDEAAAYPYTERERALVADRLSTQIIGNPDTVRRDIDALLDDTEADELMVTTMVYDPRIASAATNCSPNYNVSLPITARFGHDPTAANPPGNTVRPG
jgi:alkanesulfonate monooxygenase SsuD/methylene tetrahydromethanopterin reductase-like flavin-dependent oxidoreductase (luciferase family)